jgi:hypothetical protein
MSKRLLVLVIPALLSGSFCHAAVTFNGLYLRLNALGSRGRNDDENARTIVRYFDIKILNSNGDFETLVAANPLYVFTVPTADELFSIALDSRTDPKILVDGNNISAFERELKNHSHARSRTYMGTAYTQHLDNGREAGEYFAIIYDFKTGFSPVTQLKVKLPKWPAGLSDKEINTALREMANLLKKDSRKLPAFTVGFAYTKGRTQLKREIENTLTRMSEAIDSTLLLTSEGRLSEQEVAVIKEVMLKQLSAMRRIVRSDLPKYELPEKKVVDFLGCGAEF